MVSGVACLVGSVEAAAASLTVWETFTRFAGDGPPCVSGCLFATSGISTNGADSSDPYMA